MLPLPWSPLARSKDRCGIRVGEVAREAGFDTSEKLGRLEFGEDLLALV
jgi:hypothetical protein